MKRRERKREKKGRIELVFSPLETKRSEVKHGSQEREYEKWA